MKKLLIATTALVATAGMASADITITGHAAAGIYSGLDATAKVTGRVPATLQSTTDATVVANVVTAGTATKLVAAAATVAETSAADLLTRQNAVRAAEKELADADTELKNHIATVKLADAKANLAAA